MIDFHNHVLPGVDDGPRFIEESIQMLKKAAEQGITDIVQTVHFQHPKMEGKDTSYNFLKSKLETLQKEIDKINLKIKLHLSAEVFYLPNLTDILDNPLVTVGNGNYMLIEFKNNIYPTGYEEEFYKIQMKGVTPIVAHPERYRFIQNDLNILNQWLIRGYIIQIDAGSILGHFGDRVRDISIQMLNRGLVHIIGSDAHNNKKRDFCILDAYNQINDIFNKDYISFLKKNSVKLLSGNKITNYEKINDRQKNKYFVKLKKIFLKF